MRTHTQKLSLIPGLLASLLLTQAIAQDAEPADSQDRSELESRPRPIEEITVVGQQSLARLQLRIEQKEEEIYAFFNANNSSDRFDILCSTRRPTGTHIRQRECEPKFLKDLRVERTRDMRLGIGVRFTQLELVELSAQDYETLQNEMLQLMASNKDFADSLADLAELTENYEAHWEALFGKSED